MISSVLLTTSPPGLYRMACGPGVLQARVERSHWRWYHANGAGVADREAFFACLATALAFPDYFGANWDAMLDCLRDLSDDAVPGVALYMTGFAAFVASHPSDWTTAQDVFTQAVSDLATSGTALYVLIAGPAGRGLTALLP